MFEWAGENVRLYGTLLSCATILFFVAYTLLNLKLKLAQAQKEKPNKPATSFLTLVFLVGIACAVRLPFAWINGLAYDEPLYISASLNYMEGFNQGLGSEAFLANYEHPPLVKYLMGLCLRLVTPNTHINYGSPLPDNSSLLLYSRLFNVLMGSISIIPLFLLTEKLRKDLGIPSSVFLALNASHARMSGFALLDTSMIFFGLCTMLSVFNLAVKPSWKGIAISGVFTGLLLGTKWLQPIPFLVAVALLIAICHRKAVFHFMACLAIGVGVLLVLWLPLIWRFGIYGIKDFFLWIHSFHLGHFTPNGVTWARDVLELALWNMSVIEFVLFSFCLIIVSALTISDIKSRKLTDAFVLPLITVIVFLISFQIDNVRSYYYWTMITPFTSMMMPHGSHFFSDMLFTHLAKRHLHTTVDVER